MIETFSHGGISLKYPSNWNLEIEEDETDWTATLESPKQDAMLIVRYSEDEQPAAMADEALESLQEDYEELDSEIAFEPIAGQTAMGHNIDILTLDTPVVIRTRAVTTGDGGLLLLWQYRDADKEHYEPVFAAMISSMSNSQA